MPDLPKSGLFLWDLKYFTIGSVLNVMGLISNLF